MSTNDKRLEIFNKKFLNFQNIEDNVVNYLLKASRDVMKDVYPVQGVIDGGTLSGDGANKFQVSTPFLGTDGSGKRIAPDPSEVQDVQFQNTISIDYHVGIRHNEIPNGTEVNVRTGAIEYSLIEERIGERGDPDNVIDNGTTLRFEIDALTEVGVTHAGRLAMVWLKNAVSQSQAFFTGTIAFVGGKNVLDTTHLLGQTAGSVSTTEADYEVLVIGPTVRRNTDLSLDPTIIYLGTVEGAGLGNAPTVFDQSGMNTLPTPGEWLQYILDTLATIVANEPKEQDFTADGIASTFTVSAFTFLNDNTKFDISVYIDGRKQKQDVTGTTLESYKKISTTQIQTTSVPTVGSKVTVRKEGTSTAIAGSFPGEDSNNPAAAFYLLDQFDLTTVWKLQVVNGVLGIVSV